MTKVQPLHEKNRVQRRRSRRPRECGVGGQTNRGPLIFATLLRHLPLPTVFRLETQLSLLLNTFSPKPPGRAIPHTELCIMNPNKFIEPRGDGDINSPKPLIPADGEQPNQTAPSQGCPHLENGLPGQRTETHPSISDKRVAFAPDMAYATRHCVNIRPRAIQESNFYPCQPRMDTAREQVMLPLPNLTQPCNLAGLPGTASQQLSACTLGGMKVYQHERHPWGTTTPPEGHVNCQVAPNSSHPVQHVRWTNGAHLLPSSDIDPIASRDRGNCGRYVPPPVSSFAMQRSNMEVVALSHQSSAQGLQPIRQQYVAPPHEWVNQTPAGGALSSGARCAIVPKARGSFVHVTGGDFVHRVGGASSPLAGRAFIPGTGAAFVAGGNAINNALQYSVVPFPQVGGPQMVRNPSVLSASTLRKKIRKLWKCHCNSCDAFFENKCDRDEHMRSTHRARHKCQHCTSRFRNKCDQERHERSVHKGERPHVCEECSAAFYEKSKLKRHVQTVHDNRRPHKCDFCSKAFGEAGNLRQHIRSRHSDATSAVPAPTV